MRNSTFIIDILLASSAILLFFFFSLSLGQCIMVLPCPQWMNAILPGILPKWNEAAWLSRLPFVTAFIVRSVMSMMPI